MKYQVEVKATMHVIGYEPYTTIVTHILSRASLAVFVARHPTAKIVGYCN